MSSERSDSHAFVPPLPPRPSRQSSMASQSDAPPPYEAIAHQAKAYEKASQLPPPGLVPGDPRTSSQQSLLPQHEDQERRRTLLVVYIHGFMGNETSFRSFPAHVHNLLTVLLSATHVVHTKIYPRYRSRGQITIARDDFSRWISAHEGDSVDVILAGHSMGGLLSAEVALMPAAASRRGPLQHRIVGSINFDVPFLGMHPGVVKSGLCSIFKPSEEANDDKWDDDKQSLHSESSSLPARSPSPAPMDPLWAPGKADPNYNPSFANDVVLPVRKGWRNAWHFINKHSDDLTKATKKLVSSHLEFGGAMANYSELKRRYARIRALEEPDDGVRQSVTQGGVPPRVHFVNYYTVSTGRPKKAHSPLRNLSASPHGSRPTSRASSRPSLVPESMQSKDSLLRQKSSDQAWEHAMDTLTIEDKAVDRHDRPSSLLEQAQSQSMPTKPPPLPDLSYIQDPTILELVKQEHARAMDAYEQAVRDREQSDSHSQAQASPKEDKGKQPVRQQEPDRGRQRHKPESEMTHSEREMLRLEKEKERMEREGRRLRGEPDAVPEPASEPDVPPEPTRTPPRVQSPPAASIAPSTTESASTHERSSLAPVDSRERAPKSKKDRTFCNLPPKDSNGEVDPCWVKVFMEDVDEVGAHCGLFFVDERYERLVGDVASRIEGWVNDEMGSRSSQAWKS